MGQSTTDDEPLLLPTGDSAGESPATKIPKDSFHFVYLIYFTLGLGFLLPWNTFITAVDYFAYLYPGASVDRVFAVAYMMTCLVFLVLVVLFAHRAGESSVRINLGLGLFVACMLAVPALDAFYVKGRVGVYAGFDATVVAVAVAGLADVLVQGGVVGSAGELPERYMQAVVAGTAASGVLVSVLRILTKAVYPQDVIGLRKSANLYFTISIVSIVICIVLYNMAPRLPVMKYYKQLKIQAVNEEKFQKGPLTGKLWRSTLWDIFGRVKYHGFGIVLIYLVTLSIFPGFITEDVHSELLKDWYSIVLITGYNVFDLLGKSLTAVYLVENEKVAVCGTVARLLFFPLFYGCLHGPEFFRTEIPVTILTCLLGLTNGYLTSVLMILAPKNVPLQHAETAGIVIVLFLVLGLALGSVVSWVWVI